MKRNYKPTVLFWTLIVSTMACKAEGKVDVVEANGNPVEDYSDKDKIGFEITWVNINPVTVSVSSDAAGKMETIEANIGSRNESGTDWRGFHMEITGKASWGSIQQICPWDSRPIRLRTLANYTKPVFKQLRGGNATIGFNPPIPSPGGLVLGTCGRNEGSNWPINIGELKPGQSFTIRIWPSSVDSVGR